MMSKIQIRSIFIAILSFTLLTGFGFKLKDLKKKIDPSVEQCKDAKDKSKCKKEKKLKAAGKVIAAGLAAKAIYDVVVHFKSKQTENEKQVATEYKKKNKSLPKNAKVFSYVSSLKPGQVVPTGKPIKVVSEVKVVAGKKTKKVKIQEKIEFFDSENKDEVIKSLVKDVNKKTQQAGSYANSFTFTLPKGMPQGVYRIRTAILLNDKEVEKSNNDMQVVFFKTFDNSQQVAMLLP